MDTPGRERASRLLSRTVWNVAAGALAVALVVLMARAARWSAVVEEVRRARIPLLLFAWLGLGSLACFLRGARWYALLSPKNRPEESPEESKVKFWPVFWANSSGYLGNNVLPLRAGELIRAAMVNTQSGLGKRFILSVSVCERVFDLLVLMTLTRMALLGTGSVPAFLNRAMDVAWMASLAGVALLVAAPRLHSWIDRAWIDRRWTHSFHRRSLADRLWETLRPFAEGVRMVHQGGRLAGFLALTVLIWLVDAWGARLVAASLGIDLPFALALVLLAALACSGLLPATPGQIGIFQFVTIRVLAVAHASYDAALAYSLVLQAGSYLALGAWGAPGFWMQRKRKDAEASGAPASGREAGIPHPG